MLNGATLYEGNVRKGTVLVKDAKGKETKVRYCLMHFDEPSKYGIDGGRISKLNLRIGDEWIANYDRAWDFKPRKKVGKQVLALLMQQYN